MTFSAHGDDNGLIGVRVLDGVVEQVGNDLFESRRIGEHKGSRSIQAHVEHDVPPGQAVREGVDGFLNQRAQIDLLELERALLLDPRELQHTLHQHGQPLRFGADGVEVLRQPLRRADAIHLQRLGRRAQQR